MGGANILTNGCLQIFLAIKVRYIELTSMFSCYYAVIPTVQSDAILKRFIQYNIAPI